MFVHKNTILGLLTLGLSVLMAACSTKSGTYITGQDVARVTAFYLKNDSVPALKTTTFKVYEVGPDTVGLIINKDSMAYGTRLDSVVPKFSFYYTPSSAVLEVKNHWDPAVPDTILALHSNDTLNLEADSIILSIRSYDGTAKKTYQIVPLVHKQDPDLFTWTRVAENLYPERQAEQQLLRRGYKLFLFVADGTSAPMLYTADGGDIIRGTSSWSSQQLTSLTADCQVRQIVLDTRSGAFWYGRGYTIYHSQDGANWVGNSTEDEILATLFAFPGADGEVHPWFVIRTTTGAALAYWADGEMVRHSDVELSDIAVSGFEVVHYLAASNHEALTVIGGQNIDAEFIRSRWMMEYTQQGGPRRASYEYERCDMPYLIGSSVVLYDEQLMLFGGQDKDYNYLGATPYLSADKGVHWTIADTAHCQMPASFGARRNVCSTEYGNYIILVGGADNVHNYSDIYIGRKAQLNNPIYQ